MSDPAITDPATLEWDPSDESQDEQLQQVEGGVQTGEELELQHRYVFWLNQRAQQSKGKTGQPAPQNVWENEIKAVAKFGTAEEFWHIYQFLKRPDQLSVGSTLNLFVEGIKPMWEDEANKNGGRWTLRVSKGFGNKLWEDLILAMIGEQFSDEDEICGIVISIRQQGDQISIWNRNGRDKEKVERIKNEIVSILSLPENVKMDYNVFNEHEEHQTPQSKPHHHPDQAPGKNNFDERAKTLQKFQASGPPTGAPQNSGGGQNQPAGRGGFRDYGSRGGYDSHRGNYDGSRGRGGHRGSNYPSQNRGGYRGGNAPSDQQNNTPQNQ